MEAEPGVQQQQHHGMPSLLEGVRVIDLSRVLAAPFAARILAEMGADVVKVEHGRGDPARGIEPHVNGRSLYFSSLNSGKRGVYLDIAGAPGRRALDALIGRADVVVENYRPSVGRALGLDGATLVARHPGLVAVSISGFARSDERGDERAFDLNIQAEGGVMAVTGSPEGPPVRAGVALSDLAAGMWAAMGACAALFRRAQTGEGRHLEVPMLDGTLPLLAYVATAALHAGVEPARVGSGHHSVCPYGAFPSADGWVVLAVLTDKFWLPACEVLGLDELAARPELARNAGRAAARSEIELRITEATGERTSAEVVAALRASGVPAAPLNGVIEALTAPYVRDRGLVAQIDAPETSYEVVQGPLWDGSRVRPAPSLGEHNEEVLSEVLAEDPALLAAALEASGAPEAERERLDSE